MKTLTTEELKQALDQNEDLLLINVLPKEAFHQEHIPGSLNVPLDRETFVTDVDSIAVEKDRRIVVYCSGADCEASPNAAAKLDEAGFTNVEHYKDGLAGWRKAGQEVESGIATGAG